MLSQKSLAHIFQKTDGHCHFCGDLVVFEKYGVKDVQDTQGAWEADHVRQKGKGGSKNAENCLPACYRCNRLRWHRKGEDIRELLFLGLIAKDQIKKGNDVGKELIDLKKKRLQDNTKRRRRILSTKNQSR